MERITDEVQEESTVRRPGCGRGGTWIGSGTKRGARARDATRTLPSDRHGLLASALRAVACLPLLCTLCASGGCGEGLPESSAETTARGELQFEVICAPCHGPDGAGMPGRAPPLSGSPWVSGPDDRLIRVVLHGVRGRLQVGPETYDLEMPALGRILDDAEVAGVISHVRERFGEGGPAVEPGTVGRIRRESRGRTRAWTSPELLLRH